MESTRLCPACQTPLRGDEPMGLCPRCLITTPSLFPDLKHASPSNDSTAPLRFENYELQDDGREGGMGVVYMALQPELDRIVALKMIRFKRHLRESDRARFEIEARAMASLKHDHIVQIHETDIRNGQPYFSMEWMAGGDLRGELSKWKTAPMPVARAVQLILPITLAVEHAHRHGILHRDLNPRNILFDEAGQPHVSDFGLAKVLNEDDDLTRTGQGMGSPGYTSPEQALGKTDEVTTVSDVFSLGAILYHLLTNKPPFPTQNWEVFLDQLAHADPEPPSAINPHVDADLETVCMKCLEKIPAQRYSSANELAGDLDRWIRKEPVRARPINVWGRLTRWCRRKPAVASLSTAVAVTLVVGMAGVLSQWRRAELHRKEVAAANVVLRLQRAEDHFANDNTPLAIAALARITREHPENRVATERLVQALTQRRYLLPTKQIATNLTASHSIHRSGAIVVSGRGTNALTVREVPSGRVLLTIPNAHDKVIRSAGFSSDGARIISAAADATVKVWDAGSGTLIFTLPHADAVHHAEFSPDDRRILTASRNQSARLWSGTTGLPIGDGMRHRESVVSARFNRDGSQIVTAADDDSIRLWDGLTAQPISEPARLPAPPLDARFSLDDRNLSVQLADGRHLVFAVSSPRGILRASPAEAESAEPHPSNQEEPALAKIREGLAEREGATITRLALSPDQKRVAVGRTDFTARIWDAQTLEALGSPLVHDGKVNCVRFDPTGRRLVTSTARKSVRVWDVETSQPLCDTVVFPEGVAGVRFSDDGDWILTSSGWKFRFHPSPRPAPHWLPNLAEAMAGMRFTERDLIELVAFDSFRLQHDALRRDPDGGPLRRWALDLISNVVE